MKKILKRVKETKKIILTHIAVLQKRKKVMQEKLEIENRKRDQRAQQLALEKMRLRRVCQKLQ